MHDIKIYSKIQIKKLFYIKCIEYFQITGGANGLGREVGLLLAQHGCNIAIADIDIKQAEKTALEISNKGVKSKAYQVDVSNYTEIESLREQIGLDFGNVDILINNAGLIPFASLVDQKANDIERLFKVNVNSPILVGFDIYILF